MNEYLNKIVVNQNKEIYENNIKLCVFVTGYVMLVDGQYSNFFTLTLLHVQNVFLAFVSSKTRLPKNNGLYILKICLNLLFFKKRRKPALESEDYRLGQILNKDTLREVFTRINLKFQLVYFINNSLK